MILLYGMLCVKTKLLPSKIHGIGLFADQFIPQGTVTWKYHPIFDHGFTEEQIQEMTEPARAMVLWYAYFDFNLNKYILCFDDQRFINHSKKNFNIISTPTADTAVRDIHQGEELLCDYNMFDKEYWKRHKIDPETLL